MKTILIAALFFLSINAQSALPSHYAVVANRGESTISLIDSQSLEVVKTIGEKSVGYEFEPMYASHLSGTGVFVVGDRKASQLLIFDDESGELLLLQPLSKGVFHQWTRPGDNEVVVATDTQPGADLIRITRGENGEISLEKRRFNLPSNHEGSVPHDVVLDDSHFYLTAHAQDASGKMFDKIFKVERETLEVEDVMEFSADVHVGLPQNSPYLLVAEQSGVLNFLTRDDMTVVKRVTDLTGAHGLFWKSDASTVYSANISSRAMGALYVINNKPFGPANLVNILDSSSDTPHNLVADFDNNVLFLTHSGMNNIVSVYDISNGAKLMKSITTGANPFGIGIVQRK